MRAIYQKAATLTPSDANPVNVGFPVAAVFVGASGDVVATMNGTDVTFTVPGGSTLPISPRYVKATGTTATLLLALGL